MYYCILLMSLPKSPHVQAAQGPPSMHKQLYQKCTLREQRTKIIRGAYPPASTDALVRRFVEEMHFITFSYSSPLSFPVLTILEVDGDIRGDPSGQPGVPQTARAPRCRGAHAKKALSGTAISTWRATKFGTNLCSFFTVAVLTSQ